MNLSNVLSTWQTPAFKKTLQAEMEQMDVRRLPLQQGLTRGNYALQDNISVSIIRVSEADDNIIVNAGIFYQSLIAGCSCADDPTPVEELNEYCEVQLIINKTSAETTITLTN
jgi:hypothetical protein